MQRLILSRILKQKEIVIIDLLAERKNLTITADDVIIF